MTVILQHQFWDLAVSDTGFEVGLSFGGIPEKLGVPFDAIKGFFDPSVQFGLQFEEAGEVPGEQAEEPQGTKQPAKPTPVAPPPAAAPAAPATAAAAAEKPKEKPEVSGAEVVSLDRFRKK
jgi:hypothetical protein